MALRDKCLFCGEPVSITGYCTSCRLKQDHLKKAFNTSIYYYNIAQEKASARDLSGAKTALLDALRYNKQNVNARNLLGLIYYETGELVMAMNHWVMSINYKPKNNPATEYLKDIRDDKKFLEDIGQSYVSFNQALDYAKKRDFDLAILHLRKSLSTNKKFVKAYLLLSLIYMEKDRKGLAKKALTKVVQIDRQNETALRYFRSMGISVGSIGKLIEENTKEDSTDYYGLETGKEVSSERTPKKIIPVSSDGATRRQMLKRYREKNLARFSNLYVILGIIVGVAVLYLLIVPVSNKEKTIEVNQLRTTYSKDISAKNTEIDNLYAENEILNKKISEYASETDALTKKIEDLSDTVETLNTRLSEYDPTGVIDGSTVNGAGNDQNAAGTDDAANTQDVDTEGTDGAAAPADDAENPDNTDGTTDGADDSANADDAVNPEVASGNNDSITGISVAEINSIINGE